MSGSAKKIIIGVIGVVVLVAVIAGVLIASAFVGWRQAVRSGNEAATIQNLKAIAAVEIQYFNSHNRNFGTFDQMVKEQMLDARFSENAPIVDGYVLTLKVTPKTTSQPSSSYSLNADPVSDSTGRNHFYLGSTSGSIRVNPDRPASANDPLFVQ